MSQLLINTSFHADPAIADDCLSWLRNEYIPAVNASGHFNNVLLLQIDTATDSGIAAFALQMRTQKSDEVNHWLRNENQALLASLFKLFAERVLFFTTEMSILSV